MRMQWGALGELTFQTGFSPKRISIQQKFRLTKHPVINDYPQLDNLGEDVRTLNLEISLSSLFVNIKWALDYIYEVAQKGEKLPLTVGMHYLGEWVIESYQISELETTTDGEPVRAEVSLVLNKVKPSEGSWKAI